MEEMYKILKKTLGDVKAKRILIEKGNYLKDKEIMGVVEVDYKFNNNDEKVEFITGWLLDKLYVMFNGDTFKIIGELLTMAIIRNDSLLILSDDTSVNIYKVSNVATSLLKDLEEDLEESVD